MRSSGNGFNTGSRSIHSFEVEWERVQPRENAHVQDARWGNHRNDTDVKSGLWALTDNSIHVGG